MQANFSLQFELGPALMGLPTPRGFGTHCTDHCSTFVAQAIRAMMT